VPTSEELLRKLGKALDARSSRIQKYDSYYQGEHRAIFQNEKYRPDFQQLIDGLADNFCKLVVDSVEERLNPEGFLIPQGESEPTESRSKGDREAWRIWQENGLDADSQLAHTEALIKEQSYGLVWGAGDQPIITVEDPFQMIVLTAAGNRRRRIAALKRWVDESGYLFATLYLPDRIEKYQSVAKADTLDETAIIDTESIQWEKRELRTETWPLTNPLGIVPVVPLINSPRSNGSGESEIKAVVPIQDSINELVGGMLIAAKFGAAQRLWATGVNVPKDEAGKEIIPFRVTQDRMMYSPSENARFGVFREADLSPWVTAIGMRVQHIASITRTPPHYFLANMGNFPSGEALMAAETGLVKKAKRKMRHFGEAWEEIIRLAFLVKGDKRANVTNSETIWGDPESRNEALITDSTIKRYQGGLIPWDQALEDMGYTPTQIESFEADRDAQGLPKFVPMESIQPVPPPNVTNVTMPAP
jgi:hypothetical protein